MRPKVTSSVRRIPKLHTSDLMENLGVGDDDHGDKDADTNGGVKGHDGKMLTMKMTMLTNMKMKRITMTLSVSPTCCSWLPLAPSI